MWISFLIACRDISGDSDIDASQLKNSKWPTMSLAAFETGVIDVNRGHRNFLLGWRHSFYSLAAAITIAMSPAPTVASETYPSGVLGYWLAESRKTAVEFHRCDDKLCATLVWLAKPYRKSGEFKRDQKNPDPILRTRGWCGIEVVKGLKAKHTNVWTKGEFYYPKKGKTYSLDIKLLDDGRLELRAYLGIRLFGKTETWLRPDPDRTFACVPVPDS
jgi:uncharacterized protein (DUF2147 family)